MTPPAVRVRPAIIDFGQRVRALRMKAKITQRELARRACIRELFVSQVELGKSNPSLATIVFLAAGLGCDVVELFQPVPRL